MEKELVKHNHNTTAKSGASVGLRERSATAKANCFLNPHSSETDFVLSWGKRKRLRCMKTQAKEDPTQIHKSMGRRIARVAADSNGNTTNNTNLSGLNHCHFNLRQRPASPARVNPTNHRAHRNQEGYSSAANNNNNMKGTNNTHGGIRGHSSPDGAHVDGRKAGAHESCGRTTSSDAVAAATAAKAGSGGSSSGGDGMPAVWPPKFMIALTNKEKEEDFMAIKGSKLPHRPKKRAKLIQRTVNYL